MDNKALYIHKNGTYLSNGSNVGVPTSGSSRTGSLIETQVTGSRDDYILMVNLSFLLQWMYQIRLQKQNLILVMDTLAQLIVSSEGTNPR